MDVYVPRACGWMEDLRAGCRIHGQVGQRVSHLVVGADVVSPRGDPGLISESSSFYVVEQESWVLRSAVVAELVDDQVAVPDDLERRPQTSSVERWAGRCSVSGAIGTRRLTTTASVRASPRSVWRDQWQCSRSNSSTSSRSQHATLQFPRNSRIPVSTPRSTKRVLAIAAVLFTASVFAENLRVDRSLQSTTQCLTPERFYDYTGNDLSNRLTTADGCCAACSSTPACNAYTWTKYQGGSCYLKTKKTESVLKGADTDGSAYFISGEVYKCQPVQTNRDLAGVDLKNVPASKPESCCAECRQTSGCSGFAWNSYNGGTCYLKTGPVLKVATTNVYAAVL